LLKDRDVLLLESRSKTKDARQFITINETDTLVTIQHSTFNIKHSAVKIQQSISIKFDKNLLKFPLIVRKWQKGDYFYPIGMEGKKKLSKYFKDEKISLIEKENIWLLLSDNEIVWIIGKRQDERFKITSRTTQILEFYKTEHNE
ncbi:MAG: tRNA lysidine(34) synthetase TilS, partial [Flavobacteriaceae bacterium]